MRIVKKMAECHPDRPLSGKKMCSECYGNYRKDIYGKEHMSEIWRKSRLKCKYDLTVEQYEEMSRKQGGVCAICSQLPKLNKRLSVDHDHKCCPGEKTCGKCIRGLLCDRCNRYIIPVLEMFLEKALKYLNIEYIIHPEMVYSLYESGFCKRSI